MSLQYVVGDKAVIGFLLPCAKGTKAYDSDGRLLGMFDNGDLAAAAYAWRPACLWENRLTQ